MTDKNLLGGEKGSCYCKALARDADAGCSKKPAGTKPCTNTTNRPRSLKLIVSGRSFLKSEKSFDGKCKGHSNERYISLRVPYFLSSNN